MTPRLGRTLAWALGLVLLVAAVVVLVASRPTGAGGQAAAGAGVVAAATPSPSPDRGLLPPPPAPIGPAPLRPAAPASAEPGSAAAGPAAAAPGAGVDPELRSVAQPGLDVRTVLGPPPGPQADRRPVRTAAPPDRYAFLFGVTHYRSPTRDTIGGANDVLLIRDSLLAQGWLPGNIRVATDGQATGRALREGVAWLVAKGEPGTFTMFHFSGHVKQKGGTREALWPVDRDFVDDTVVTRVLAGVRGRLWVDIAGCEAASFVDGLPGDRVLVTASSRQTEKSYEYPPWSESIWTGLLFDLGLRQGRADADADGRTTVGESLRYATYYAQALTLGQQPHGQQTPQVVGADDLGWTLADPPA